MKATCVKEVYRYVHLHSFGAQQNGLLHKNDPFMKILHIISIQLTFFLSSEEEMFSLFFEQYVTGLTGGGESPVCVGGFSCDLM